jgi:S-adenosylmethionine:tRNA ribosyltransferase-isomerase
LARLRAKGVQIEFVTLHVGLGTFLPVKVRDTKFHKMHREKYEIGFQTAKNLNKSIKEGKRIIAVGTTSVRVLEDNFGRYGGIIPGSFETNILIEPGYKWKVIRALITNFHLPKSTLLLLVSAFMGKEKALELYEKAVIRGLKFFSFGDGMLIL